MLAVLIITEAGERTIDILSHCLSFVSWLVEVFPSMVCFLLILDFCVMWYFLNHSRFFLKHSCIFLSSCISSFHFGQCFLINIWILDIIFIIIIQVLIRQTIMKKCAIELFVIVKVTHRLLHIKLNSIAKEENNTKAAHDKPKHISLSSFGIRHIFPNIVWWFWSTLYLNFFPKNLQLCIINNLLCLTDIFVIFEGNKDTADGWVILLFLQEINLMLCLKHISWVGILNSLSSFLQ